MQLSTCQKGKRTQLQINIREKIQKTIRSLRNKVGKQIKELCVKNNSRITQEIEVHRKINNLGSNYEQYQRN